ncbi:cytidine deaminase [Legionella pneumophila]|nr:cytidine deaminase [Legionella pneumophila]VEB30191.1 cytidine deaminase [Legionella pneumophila]
MDKLTSNMINEAHKVLVNAYAPYSKFSVAACICTDKNNFLYRGNVENISYGLTTVLKFQRFVIWLPQVSEKIKSIVVLAANNLLCSPCGACDKEFMSFHPLIPWCISVIKKQYFIVLPLMNYYPWLLILTLNRTIL